MSIQSSGCSWDGYPTQLRYCTNFSHEKFQARCLPTASRCFFSWKPETRNTSGVSLTFERARTRMFHAQHRTRSSPPAGCISNPQETARGMKRQAVLRSAEMALIGCQKLNLGAKDSIFDPLTLHQQSLRFDPFESRHPPKSSSVVFCYEVHLQASSTAPPYSMALQTPKLAQWFVDRLKVGYVALDPSHNADPTFYSSSSFVSNSFHSTVIFL